MNSRAHVFVYGDVQGVFFRANTRDRASSLGLTGFVRNLPDGRVECVFEGGMEAVKEMIKFCERGPSGARVEHVEVEWDEFQNEFEGFGVRY